MKTIEERAEASVTFKKVGGDLADNDVFIHNIHAEGKREGYIQGATEQKAIDDKLYEDIIANECTASYESGLEQGRRDIIEKAYEWLKNWMLSSRWYTMEESLEMFRKAMEE